jgi:hypothetical protein
MAFSRSAAIPAQINDDSTGVIHRFQCRAQSVCQSRVKAREVDVADTLWQTLRFQDGVATDATLQNGGFGISLNLDRVLGCS